MAEVCFRRMKRNRQQHGRADRDPARQQKETSEINRVPMFEGMLDERRADAIRDERAESEDHDIEKALRAGAHVFREVGVHEDIDGREEEGVTNAVDEVHQHNERRMIRQECKDREPRQRGRGCR